MQCGHLVLRAQTHRTKYEPGDDVKCFVTVHCSNKVVEAAPPSAQSPSPNSTSSLSFITSMFSSTVAATPVADKVTSSSSFVPFDVGRLYPSTENATQLASSNASSNSGSSITIHNLCAQLVGCCFADKGKLLPWGCGADASLRAAEETFGSEVFLAEPTKRSLRSPDVIGKNEVMRLITVTDALEPISGATLRLGEERSIAAMFPLRCFSNSDDSAEAVTSCALPPSYRSPNIRIVYVIHISVLWSCASGSGQSMRRETSLRVPLRVYSRDVVKSPKALPRFPRPVVSIADGCSTSKSYVPFVHLPNFPSPGVCPPLADALVPQTQENASFGDSRGVSSKSHQSVGGLRLSPSVHELYELSAPTDYIIRHKESHTMNLCLESSVAPVGGVLQGALVRNPYCQDARVVKVTMCLQCVESTAASLLAKGSNAVYLSSSKKFLESRSVSDEDKVVLSANLVEEFEFILLNSLHTPFRICLTPSKYFQTIKTDFVSVEWILCVKFWCCDQTFSTGGTGQQQRANGAGLGAERLMKLECQEELELPITVLPPPSTAQSPHMGPVVFAV